MSRATRATSATPTDALQDLLLPGIVRTQGPGRAATFRTESFGDRWVHVTDQGHPGQLWLFFGTSQAGPTPPARSLATREAAQATLEWLLR